ncbi:hypothetical protein BDQ17DRAFT_1298247 [Cyathus striatus]|nr:hypothetical protein BDQ17DRAFT_1298247 [Cyathus striatus]
MADPDSPHSFSYTFCIIYLISSGWDYFACYRIQSCMNIPPMDKQSTGVFFGEFKDSRTFRQRM